MEEIPSGIKWKKGQFSGCIPVCNLSNSPRLLFFVFQSPVFTSMLFVSLEKNYRCLRNCPNIPLIMLTRSKIIKELKTEYVLSKTSALRK